MEGEQSAVLVFYAGAQNAHVGQIYRPRKVAAIKNPFLRWASIR